MMITIQYDQWRREEGFTDGQEVDRDVRMIGLKCQTHSFSSL